MLHSRVLSAPGVFASTLFLAALLLGVSAFSASAGTQLEREVLRELNSARTDPGAFVAHLRRHRALFTAKLYRPPGADYSVSTREGTAAVDEAIAFLQQHPPLPPFAWSEGLARAAAELVRAQGRSGEIGHGSGREQMEERIGRHLEWSGSIGENIAYGPAAGRDVVLQLIVDDGVPGRGHRTNIFSREFRLVGVACGPHPTGRNMCVMDFAADARK